MPIINIPERDKDGNEIKEQDKPVEREKPQKKRGGRFKFFTIGFFLGVILMIGAMGFAFYAGTFSKLHDLLYPPEEPVMTEAFISGRLEAASELTSAKYIYSGIMDYSEGSIPGINKTTFSMYYEATVRAGIPDMSAIGIEVSKGTVTVTLPATRIIDVHIHPDSLRFFDQRGSIFHTNDHDQVVSALKMVEQDAKDADMSELLDLADEQLEVVIRGMLADTIGDNELVIVHEERRDSTAKHARIDSEGDEEAAGNA